MSGAERPGYCDCLARWIREQQRLRRRRETVLPGLFADPAWDMLLDLTAARLERREVTVSSLTIASGVPPTTAMGQLARLVARGVILRTAHPHDGRKVIVTIGDDAFAAMLGLLDRLATIGGAA